MQDLNISQVESAEKSNEILSEFNRILAQDRYKITRNKGVHHLVLENDDLVLIGSGGFANVYRQKSTGLIVTFAYRVLKDSFPFVVKETAANILRFVATDVNRFSAQRLVEELKEDGLEPMIEDILDS